MPRGEQPAGKSIRFGDGFDGAKPALPATAGGQGRPAGASDRLVVADGREPGIVAFERQTVDFFVSAADILGIPKSVAAIYAIVFASPVALSFAEVAGRLNISKGSISQGLRVLREVGALREEQLDEEAGLRKRDVSIAPRRGTALARGPARYEPDLEMRKLVSHFLERRVRNQLESGRIRLGGLKQALPPLAHGDSRVLRDRLGALENWHRKARALLPVARTFLKLTPI